jgi:ribokinase
VIVVFGSLNVDFVTRVAAIPAPGETVLGPSYAVIPGGKGANQALAAARAGANVTMLGAVGEDAFAGIALAGLLAAGVECGSLARVAAPTGAAFIAVDDAGRNAIVVAAGANGLARADALEGLGLGAGDILLTQRETPEPETLRAARIARAAGARVILNAAPSGGFDPALLAAIDILVVNEHEALEVARACGLSSDDPDAIARGIDARFGVATLVTLGAQGALGWTGGVRRAVPALPVEVVDTTAAGDAFCGVLAAALHAGLGFSAALQRGVVAGSLACTKAGAQPGLPFADDIDRALGAAFL